MQERPTLEEIRTRMVADVASRATDEGTLLDEAVMAIMTTACAGAAHEMYGHQEIILDMAMYDTATGTYLDRVALPFGIRRLAGTYAAGTIEITGDDDEIVPEGTVLLSAAGKRYATDSEGTIAAGTLSMGITAVEAGEDSNLDPSSTVSFASPIDGVDSSATVDLNGITGGADVEDDEDLRARLYDRIQNPPSGGNSDDYVTWAKEVSGVTRAWYVEGAAASGEGTLYFVRDGDDDIEPDAEAIADVQAYIDARKPPTADITAAAPTLTAVGVTFTALSPDTSAVHSTIEDELEDLFLRDAEVAGTMRLSRLREAISLAAGEEYHSISSPNDDVTVGAGELPVLGTITWPA